METELLKVTQNQNGGKIISIQLNDRVVGLTGDELGSAIIDYVNELEAEIVHLKNEINRSGS